MNAQFHNPEPLNSDKAALVLVDHQVGLSTGIRDDSIADIKHNVVGLAKAARSLELPVATSKISQTTPRPKRKRYTRHLEWTGQFWSVRSA